MTFHFSEFLSYLEASFDQRETFEKSILVEIIVIPKQNIFCSNIPVAHADFIGQDY